MLKEILLTQHQQPKINLGFLKLHSKESYILIDKRGDLVKKSYDIPVKLFGVPFSAKKKQNIKKSGRKMALSKMVEGKTRLELPLQCKAINYLNTKFLGKEDERKLLFECRQKM